MFLTIFGARCSLTPLISVFSKLKGNPNMKKIYSVTAGLCLLLSFTSAYTQTPDQPYYHYRELQPVSGENPESSFSGTSGTGANIDVEYNRINWTINPNDASKTLTGTVTTYFRTISPNVSVITLDLRQSSFNNASLIVRHHGTVCARTVNASNILSVTLPSTIVATGTLDSITINYSGVPPAAAGSAVGYQRNTTAAAGNYIYTLSESYEDRDWWPCKADMQDKIDSMDIYVTVPWGTPTAADTFWVAANGKLVDSTITGSSRTFHYIHDYPIASYLVAVSVAKFDRFYRHVDVNGTNTQVAFYLLRGKTPVTITNILTRMDNVTQVLSAFGPLIGDYPFKQEKHGFYDGLMGASGMEHQTFSAMASSALTNSKVLVHELAHQWFGDNVSFASWNDLWLAEGFARYSEALCGELVPALAVDPYTTRSGIKSTALGQTVSAWIPDANASTSDGHWSTAYGGTVYERGAMVISMLRTLAGDSVFFKVMKQYQTDLAGKSATTDSLRNFFNRELGYNIDEFFRDYVGGSGRGAAAVGGIGYPIYNINWGNPAASTTFRVQIASQAKSATNNVTYFNGPVELLVTDGPRGSWTKDTTIVFYDWGGGNLSFAGRGLQAPVAGNMLQYNLSFTPTHVFFDDSARIMATVNTINKVSLLDMNVVSFNVKQNGAGNYASLELDDNSNSSSIILQRSGDGTTFTDLGVMSLMAGTTASKKYNYNDTDPLKGVNYYRAKYTPASGGVNYTRIIKISNLKTSNFVIVNNPVTGKLKVRQMNADPNSDNFNFMIYDAAGKLVYQTDRKFISAITELDTERLLKGTYILAISSYDEKPETIKFVIN